MLWTLLKAFGRLFALFEMTPQLSNRDPVRLQQVFIDWLISSFRSETALYPPLYFLQCLAQSFTVDLPGYLWVRLMSISTRQQTNVMNDRFLLGSVSHHTPPCSVHMPQAFSLLGSCALICVCNHAVPLLGMSSQLIPLVKTYSFCKIQWKDCLLSQLCLPSHCTTKTPFLELMGPVESLPRFLHSASCWSLCLLTGKIFKSWGCSLFNFDSPAQ